MGKRGLIKYQLTGSCTRQGYHSFVPGLIQDIARVWVLQGPVIKHQTEFIKSLGESLAGRGYEVEYWLSAMQLGGAEGVFFPQLNAAVISGSLVHVVRVSNTRISFIDLKASRERRRGDEQEQELATWQSRLLHHKRLVENLIENSLYIDEYLEQKQAEGLEKRLDFLSNEVQDLLFDRLPGERHFYATSLTLDGLMDYVKEITGNCRNRYILHGPPGCGQNRILEQAALKARGLGWEVNYYHWALDPERICLIFIPALNSALLDDSCLFISPQGGDMVIDMSGLVEEPDEGKHEQRRRLDNLLLQVQAELEEINRAQREINRLQAGEINPQQLEQQREKLEREIAP